MVPPKKEKGFSLVELMIVLVLLTIMLTLIVPLSMNWYRRQILDMQIDRLSADFKLGLKLATTNSRYVAMIIQYTPSPTGSSRPGILDISYRFQDCQSTNGNVDCSNWPYYRERDTVSLNFESMTSANGTLPPDWKIFFFTPMGEIKYCVVADCFAAGTNLLTSLQYIPSELTLEFSHPQGNPSRRGFIVLSGGGYINGFTR